MIKKTAAPKKKMKVGGVAGAKAGAKKKYVAGSTTKACPTGYTLVNGNCVDSSGKSITYPYISEKGAFYPDAKSLVSGCAKNPNNPKCKEMVDKLSPEQRKKIGLQENFKQKKGGTTMMKKKLGGVTAKKKMAAGGMTTAWPKKKPKYASDNYRKPIFKGKCKGPKCHGKLNVD